MAKTAQELLDHLASNDLIPREVMESLRRQVAKSAKPISAAAVAKTLVEHGHLTAAQGERLVGAPLPAAAPKEQAKPAAPPAKSTSSSDILGLAPLGEAPVSKPAPPKPPAKAPSKSQAEIDLLAAEMGLAPIHDEPPRPAPTPSPPASKPAAPAKAAAPAKPAAPPPRPKEKVVSLVEGLMPLDDALVPAAKQPSAVPAATAKAAPSKSAVISAGKPATASPSTITKAKAAPAPEPKLEGLEPLSPLPGDDLFGAAPAAEPFAPAAGTALGPAASLAAADLLAPAQPAVPKPTAAPRPRSKLLPILAVGAVVLLAVGGVAGYLLTRSNGDKEFELAEQDYQARQYEGAVAKYSAMIEDFPRNPRAGQARLHRGMAEILAASPSKDNWAAILPAAKKALAEIGDEPELSQLHQELAPLLTDMAGGLAEIARQGKTVQESSERLAQAKEALSLANDGRFVPGTLRQWQRLADVEESLALLERDLGRGKAIDVSLAVMKKAAEAGKLDAAFAERAKLLREYPELSSDVSLRELGQQLAKAASDSVKASADNSKGETAVAKSPVLASLSLATGKDSAAATTPGRPFFAFAGDAAYALDGATGKLLWQRPTGASGVIPVSADASSDVLLLETSGRGLVCVDPRSGALRWRQTFEAPVVGEPLAMGGQVFVATRAGRVVALDAKNGNGKSAADLPQPARLGPVAGGAGTNLYQLAVHSYLYSLSTADLKSTGAVYVGHELGSVEAAPTILTRHLVVAENRGASSAMLHVIPLDDKGVPASAVQQVEVVGHVLTPPVVLAERLLVLTDRQSVAFDYSPEGKEPLKKLGETKVVGSNSLARYGVAQAGKLWVAEEALRRFDFLPAGGSLKQSWSGFAGDAFETAPQTADDILFCVRRAAGRPGVVATALKADSGEPIWETGLAQPIVSLEVAADGQSAAIVSASGAESKLDLAAFQGPLALQSAPLAIDGMPLPPSQASLLFPGGRRILVPVGQPNQLFVLDSGAKTPRPLALPSQLAAPPIAWSEGLLCVCSSGAVHLLSPDTGAPLAEPMQMSIRAGSRLEKCSAFAAGENDSELIVSDGQNSLYHLRLEKEPQPHLAQLASAKLAAPMISPLAVLDQSVYVVDKSGGLQALSIPDLKAGKATKLDCHAVPMGPIRVGNVVLLATDRGELICLGASQKQLWKVALQAGPLTGTPLKSGEDLVLVTKGGTLLRIAGKSGEEIARAEVGQPLAGSPALLGNFVLLPTAAGGLLKVAIPEKEGAKR